jgi:uncharacterized membrane protein YedE/YeeE
MNARTAQPQVGITPNMFGIGYGLAGLATCWGYAALLKLAPALVADILFIITAAVWLVLVVGYLSQGRRCVVEPADVLNPRPVGGQIAWASSVNAAAIRRAGGASSPSS